MRLSEENPPRQEKAVCKKALECIWWTPKKIVCVKGVLGKESNMAWVQIMEN